MRKIFFLLMVMLTGHICLAQLKVAHLQTENLPNPISIDATTPRFSWQLDAGSMRNVMQTAYQIKVGLYQSPTKSTTIWAPAKVMTDQSVYIPYQGPALLSGQKYTWQVKVWDNTGKAAEWSAPATFQMGLLKPLNWKAEWITSNVPDDAQRPSPVFRKGFTIAKKISSAMAYITAHGMYEAQINGHRVGDAYFTPGYTSYNKRLQYQAYDVTNLLQPGANAVGATLGNGWYRGLYGFSGQHDVYGKDIALLLQLEITYTDGTKAIIGTDNSWKSSTNGPVRSSEIYQGSVIDDRMQQKGWSNVGFNDNAWSGVTVQNFSKTVLIATINEPVKKHEVFKPVKIFTTPKGEKVIDFGQNLVGVVQFKVSGKSGDKIVLSHAEVIDKAGNFYTENLRSATAEDTYILKGGGVETFEPAFTWQGFRYVKIEGYPGEIKADDFTATAMYSDMAPTGTFSCSNPSINQLQHNIQWGQRGNFLDIPTDCPQRDERLGWTGDAQAFSRTATYNMNVHNFFAKWLKDLSADQFPDGSVPHVIPDVLSNRDKTGGGSTGWADVSTIVPWNVYLAYGDKEILANQYNSMKAWVGFMTNKSKDNLWNTGEHFGDWLFYSKNDDVGGSSAITNKYLIAQCFYAHSTQLVINAAKVLGKTEDVTYYTALLAKVKEAFLNEYVTPKGLISSDTQTAYVLALQFDMLPVNLRQQAAKRLATNVASYYNHLTTGFLGTPYICGVLSRFGYTEVAYKLLLQDTYPSWLYPVKMGATTIWERWDGIKTDGTFETPTMNSYNHYAYGAIGDWMYRVVAGVDTKQDAPGYKYITIKPSIGGKLTYANAGYETMYGKITSDWKFDNGAVTLDVIIPANTMATVYVPTKAGAAVLESGKPVIKNTKTEDQIEGYTAVNIGSGSYHFSSIMQ